MPRRSSRHQITSAAHRIEPPTSKHAYLEGGTRQADGSVETSIPRAVPAGWRGKGPSRDKYAEFGSKNGLDKNFTYGFGGGDGGQDKGKGKDENKGNGKGNDGNDGNDGNPTKGNAKGTAAPKSQPDEGNLDDCNDDDLANFKAPTFREATSLFSHSYEEELRKRMEIAESISANFRLTGDSIAQAKEVAKEQRRQRSWTKRYEYLNAWEKAKATRTQGETKESQYDPSGPPVDCWIWQSTGQVVNCPSTPIYQWGNPRSILLGVIPIYQRGYLWKSTILGDQTIWESDILQIPVAKLQILWPPAFVVPADVHACMEYCLDPLDLGMGSITIYSDDFSHHWRLEQHGPSIRMWGT